MTDTVKPEWYSKLKRGPLPPTAPNANQLAFIMNHKSLRMKASSHRWIRYSAWSCSVLLLLTLSSYIGFKEWQKSEIKQAMIEGSSQFNDLRAATIKRFKQGKMEIAHLEEVKNGLLVFIKNFDDPGETDLDVEYVRRTWKGWKSIYGGGFHSSSLDPDLNNGLHCEYLPNADRYLNTYTPFPAIFGTVFDDQISAIVITGDKGFKQSAKLFSIQATENNPIKQRGWLVALPVDENVIYKVTGLDSNGKAVTEKVIDTSDYNSK